MHFEKDMTPKSIIFIGRSSEASAKIYGSKTDDVFAFVFVYVFHIYSYSALNLSVYLSVCLCAAAQSICLAIPPLVSGSMSKKVFFSVDVHKRMIINLNTIACGHKKAETFKQ